jgi:hypothetical protein
MVMPPDDSAESTGGRLGRPLTRVAHESQATPESPLGRTGLFQPATLEDSASPKSVIYFLPHQEPKEAQCRPAKHSFHVMDWVVRRNTQGRYTMILPPLLT